MPRDKVIITFFSLSVVALMISAAMVIFVLPAGTDRLILHFDPEHSINLLGSKGMALFMVGIVFAMNVVNFILSREIYYRERSLSYMIAFTTMVIGIFCLIATGVIVSMN